MKSYVFPGNIEKDILQIGSQQIPYMRTEMFSNLMKESEEMLLELIGCNNGKLISYTASGTGAMDAVITNYISKKKKVFVIAGGAFGQRWKSLCQYYNIPFTLYEVPFAKDIDYCDLEKEINRNKPEALLCQHHETSTGQLFNLKKISTICKKNDTSLVVDAISSFLADPLNMDELNIDICITSSQKGLNIPPGLSFVALSQHILQDKFSNSNYYFDFNENLKNLQRGQTPFSPATTLFLQLHKRLSQNIILGTDAIINTVRERALFFRTLCKQYNWEMPVETPSNCITAFFVKQNQNIIIKELIKKDIYIMPGSTPGYFRVSHLGIQNTKDLIHLAKTIYEIESATF